MLTSRCHSATSKHPLTRFALLWQWSQGQPALTLTAARWTRHLVLPLDTLQLFRRYPLSEDSVERDLFIRQDNEPFCLYLRGRRTDKTRWMGADRVHAEFSTTALPELVTRVITEHPDNYIGLPCPVLDNRPPTGFLSAVIRKFNESPLALTASKAEPHLTESPWIKSHLHHAMASHQFVVYYQPRVNTLTGDVQGVEALVRWYSPELGMLLPSQFIPCAEKSGLIIPLGRWVLRTVTRQVASWQQQGINVRVAINLSVRQLTHDTLVDDVRIALKESDLAQCPLDFELTESAVCEDESLTQDILVQLRALGAQIHLDDFGTGYSSLARLAVIRFDAIKLDKSLVQGVDNNPVLQSLVRAIVTMADALHCRVIAEGIETEGENHFLDQAGIDEKQGFLFAHPMPPERLTAWLRAHPPKPGVDDR